MSSQAPPGPAAWRCSGVTVRTQERAASVHSQSPMATRDKRPPLPTHTHTRSRTIPRRPCAQMGWQLQDLYSAWLDNDPPVCSSHAPGPQASSLGHAGLLSPSPKSTAPHWHFLFISHCSLPCPGPCCFLVPTCKSPQGPTPQQRGNLAFCDRVGTRWPTGDTGHSSPPSGHQ